LFPFFPLSFFFSFLGFVEPSWLSHYHTCFAVAVKGHWTRTMCVTVTAAVVQNTLFFPFF
jgi:hypothetical protein